MFPCKGSCFSLHGTHTARSLHLREGRQVDARHFSEVTAVIVRHEVAVVARGEAIMEPLEGTVGGGQVQHDHLRRDQV